MTYEKALAKVIEFDYKEFMVSSSIYGGAKCGSFDEKTRYCSSVTVPNPYNPDFPYTYEYARWIWDNVQETEGHWLVL